MSFKKRKPIILQTQQNDITKQLHKFYHIQCTSFYMSCVAVWVSIFQNKVLWYWATFFQGYVFNYYIVYWHLSFFNTCFKKCNLLSLMKYVLILRNISHQFSLCRRLQSSPSTLLQIKFLLPLRMKGFEIYNALICINDHTMHQR